METPKVSIIVPVYKKESYIRKCLDSILSWGTKDFDVILVDDGSPDDCGVICDSYACENQCVKVIHQENKGVSAARNEGLQIATGDYVTFVDADDEVIKGSLDKVMPFLNGDDDICIAGAISESEDRTPIFEDIVFKRKETTKVLNYILTGGKKETQIPKKATKFMSGCKEKFYRRAFILQSGIEFDEMLGRNEDVLWSCRCYYDAESIHFIPVTVYINKEDPNGITKGSSIQKTIKSFVTFIEKFDLLFKEKVSAQILGDFYFHLSLIVNYEVFRALKKKSISGSQFKEIVNQWYSMEQTKYMLNNLKASDLSIFKRLAYLLMKIHCYRLVGIELSVYHRYR